MFILVIDSDHDTRRIVNNALIKAGHIVKTTHSGSEAIRLYPLADVVFCGTNLTNKPDYSLLNYFKNENPDIKLIIMPEEDQPSDMDFTLSVKDLDAHVLKKDVTAKRVLDALAMIGNAAEAEKTISKAS